MKELRGRITDFWHQRKYESAGIVLDKKRSNFGGPEGNKVNIVQIADLLRAERTYSVISLKVQYFLGQDGEENKAKLKFKIERLDKAIRLNEPEGIDVAIEYFTGWSNQSRGRIVAALEIDPVPPTTKDYFQEHMVSYVRQYVASNKAIDVLGKHKNTLGQIPLDVLIELEKKADRGNPKM